MIIESAYSVIVNNLDNGIYLVDKLGSILVWNAAAEKITGYLAESVEGKLCSDNLLDPIGCDGNLLCFSECPIGQTLEDGESREIEAFIKHKLGHRTQVVMKTIPAFENGDISGVIVTLSQTAHKREQNNLTDSVAKLSIIDRFTGLPNRRMLEDALRLKCMEYKRGGVNFAVASITLSLNKDFTYSSGALNNAILKSVEALEASVRGNDIVGRFSEDEFLIIYAIDSEEKLQLVSDKIREAIELAIKNEVMPPPIVRIGATMVCGTDTALSIAERAKYLSMAAAPYMLTL